MEGYVGVPGGRLYTQVEGRGQPLILIHAAIVDLRSWDGMVPGLVAAGYRVIRYDMRGFGRSVAQDEEYSERDDLRAVLDAFGVRRAAVVGNSRGGCVAIETAIETPDRIAAIVGVGTEPRGFEGTIAPREQELVDEEARLAGASPRDPDAIADFMVRAWCDGPGQPQDRLPASVREAVRAAARPLYVEGHTSGRPGRMEPPANERLGELTCPVLAVAGELDLVSIVEAAHRLAEAPNARAVVWPDVAHLIGLEQPDRLVALVTEFLAPLRPWS
jgi:3-oxoadipate enol-lactonase